MTAIVLMLVALIAAVGIAVTVWVKFFKPIRSWPVSSKCKFGDKSLPEREEPFWSWWRENSQGMGMSDCVTLDGKTKRRIDVVCRDALDWKYRNDAAGIDFEPVTIDQMEGDCEDFARAMALRLMEIGIPPQAMTLGLGFHPRKGWHCILLIDTDQGTFMSEVGAPYFTPWTDNGFIRGNGGPVHGLIAPKSDGYYYDVIPG